MFPSYSFLEISMNGKSFILLAYQERCRPYIEELMAHIYCVYSSGLVIENV